MTARICSVILSDTQWSEGSPTLLLGVIRTVYERLAQVVK